MAKTIYYALYRVADGDGIIVPVSSYNLELRAFAEAFGYVPHRRPSAESARELLNELRQSTPRRRGRPRRQRVSPTHPIVVRQADYVKNNRLDRPGDDG